MKFIEVISEERLDEINMSPSSLKTIAASIDARAGMEFEMIVPGAKQADDDYEQEPDYDADESVNDIDDAINFFDDSEYNSSRDIRNLRDEMNGQFQEWLTDSFGERWDSDQSEFIYSYLKENASNDEIAEILGREDDDEDTKDNYGRAEVAEAVDKVMEEGSGNYWYDQAYEDAYQDFMNTGGSEGSEREWLRDAGMHSMRDVSQEFSINWPHYYNPDADGEIGVEEVAGKFERAIGRKVNWSLNYHGGKRESNAYVVEPDGSLEADDDEDGGLEFVSPPLPVTEMLDDLRKVKAWADATGCYTNDSTGLHINVSVPNFSLDKLDFVKLAILMGDEYILKQFGREGNTYAKSALGIVKSHIQQKPEDVTTLLNAMRDHMNQSAAKLIHNGSTSKYTSINTKDGYIEFRSPGGDWLNENFDKIENTLLRFVVAMDAALDPQKYRQEYLKKLYSLLEPTTDEYGTMVKNFSDYVAGVGGAPEQIVKDFRRTALSNLQQSRLGKSADQGKLQGKYWWNVQWDSNRRMEVVATNKQQAREVAAKEWGVTPDKLAIARVTPLRPYTEPAATPQPPAEGAPPTSNTGDWGIWVPMLNRYGTVGGEPRRFETEADARAWIQDYNTRNSGNDLELVARHSGAGSATVTAPQYEIYNRLTNVPVMPLASPDAASAWRTAQGWAAQMLQNDPSFDMSEFSVRNRT